jgi:hypothetical protein
MKFEDALFRLRRGMKMRRAVWEGDKKAPDYLILSDGKLSALSGGKGKAWNPTTDDLLEIDWEGV